MAGKIYKFLGRRMIFGLVIRWTFILDVLVAAPVVTIFYTRHGSSQSNEFLSLRHKAPLRTSEEIIRDFGISRWLGYRPEIDAPLSDLGHSQARLLGVELRRHADGSGFPLDKLLAGKTVIGVSNLVRTQQTFANFIAQFPERVLVVHILNCLQEIYENPAALCIKDGESDTSKAVTKSIVNNLPHIHWKIGDSDHIEDLNRGEGARDFRPRFSKFIEWLTVHANDGDNEFLITGHSQWLREFFRAKYHADTLSEVELDVLLKRVKLGNASMIRFEVDLSPENVHIVQGSVTIVQEVIPVLSSIMEIMDGYEDISWEYYFSLLEDTLDDHVGDGALRGEPVIDHIAYVLVSKEDYERNEEFYESEGFIHLTRTLSAERNVV